MKKENILVVEDDYLVNEGITLILKAGGYNVVGNAFNGIEAFEKTSLLKPDIILMDIEMPEMDGLEATKSIQESCPTPIVLLTAHDSQDMILKAGLVGASAYLIKPPNIDEIQRSITIAVARHDQLMESKNLNEKLKIEVLKRQQAEKESKQSEAYIKSLMNNFNDAIWSVDTDYNLVYFNSHLKEAFDTVYNIKLKPDLNLLNHIPFNQKETWEKNYEKAKLGKIVKFEFSEKLFGELHFFEVHLNPILISGKVTGISCLSIDITDRINTKKFLSKSVKSFKEIFNNAIDSIYILDASQKFIDVNKGAIKMYGYSKEEFIGKSPENISAPGLNDLPEIKKYIDHAYNDKPQQFEFWAKRKNNEVFPKLVRLSNGYYFGEKVVYAFAIEITERKKAMKALQESEERFRSLTELLPEAVFETDTKLNLTFVNNKAYELFGYTKNDFEKGLNALDMFSAEEHYRIKRNWINKKGRVLKSVEYKALKKTGEEFTVLFHESSIIKDGKYLGARGIIIDITDIKETEKALKESEEKYRLLVQNQGEGIGITDENEVFIFANPAAEKIFGIEEGGLINRSLPEFMDESSVKYIKEETGKRKKGTTSRYEIEINRPSGKIVVLDVTATPHLDKDNNFSSTFAVFRDITEKKKAENKLKNNETELRKLNATKDKFFSIISHDLKGPIGSLLNFSEIIKDKFFEYERPKQNKFLVLIYKQISDTYKLLENLLTWSRSQTKTIIFNPTYENPLDLSNEILLSLKTMAEMKSITIINEIQDNIKIKVDKNMFLTIFRNLISNAIKYTRNKGEIIISSKLYEKNSSEKIIDFSVKDNGIGMDLQTKSNLLKIEKNISIPGTEGETGTGLGLILCKEFIERHTGEIRVESEVNKGSEFVVSLPL